MIVAVVAGLFEPQAWAAVEPGQKGTCESDDQARQNRVGPSRKLEVCCCQAALGYRATEERATLGIIGSRF